METKTDILNEITSISPLVAGIQKVNVFAVPAGYFNSISETVLACLREEIGGANIAAKSEKQTYDIPEGYFDHLAATILGKIKAEEIASTEISHLSPLLHAIQNVNVFEVPDKYFDNVHKIIHDKIKSSTVKDELNGISPLLFSLREKTVFELPDGYFTVLAATILKKAQTPKTKITGIISINRVLKYAVAAMMIGVLAFGVYKYTNKPVSIIVNDNSVASLDAAIEKGKNMNDQQFNETLNNLTQADIASYLEKNGNIADVAVLGNDIEPSNLPSQEDYLLDEKTLENFLKEIDSTSSKN